MKKLSRLLFAMCGSCVVSVLLGADTLPTTTTPGTPAKLVTPSKTVAPAGQTLPKTTLPPAKPATADAKPAEKVEPLVGMLLDRPGGGYLNLKIDGGSFVIRFLDANKKKVDADLEHGRVSYRRHLKSSKHTLNRSADGKELRSSAPPVDRPYFIPGVSVVLFKEGWENVSESYLIFFKQPMAGDDQTISPEDMTPEQLQKLPK